MVKVIVWLQITFFKIKAWKSFLKYLLRRWTETEYWNILENFNSIKFFSGYTLFRICRYTKFEKQVSLKAEPNVIVVDGFSMNWLHLMFHCFPPLAATVNVYEKKTDLAKNLGNSLSQTGHLNKIMKQPTIIIKYHKKTQKILLSNPPEKNTVHVRLLVFHISRQT